MNDQNTTENRELIKAAYAAFNIRDVDGVIKFMDPEVKWARAWEGDYANGPEDVRAYWERQWKDIEVTVVPVGFATKDDGRLVVEVNQLVKDLEGNILFEGKVTHIHDIPNGLIKQMDVEKH
jgi:ketosteroid isomerase-like protein